MKDFLEEYFSNFFWLGVIILVSLLFLASGIVTLAGSLHLLMLMVDFPSFKEAWQTLLWVRVTMIAYIPCVVFLFTVYTHKQN